MRSAHAGAVDGSLGVPSGLWGGDGEKVDGAFLEDADDKAILNDVRMGKREKPSMTGERPVNRTHRSPNRV